SIIGFEKL
nr:Chain C, Ovalbumin epitope, SIIGFEKL [synthetic construct]3P9M_F Chain F, Ovalbumin epitope, SIIGFEKL [synthetic construct]